MGAHSTDHRDSGDSLRNVGASDRLTHVSSSASRHEATVLNDSQRDSLSNVGASNLLVLDDNDDGNGGGGGGGGAVVVPHRRPAAASRVGVMMRNFLGQMNLRRAVVMVMICACLGSMLYWIGSGTVDIIVRVGGSQCLRAPGLVWRLSSCCALVLLLLCVAQVQKESLSWPQGLCTIVSSTVKESCDDNSCSYTYIADVRIQGASGKTWVS